MLELLVLGALVLAAGVALVWWGRTRRGRTAAVTAVLLLVAVGGAMTAGFSPPAVAADAPVCRAHGAERPQLALHVVQTSRITGLAPDAPAAAISGLAVNDGNRPLLVTAVSVRIAAVAAAPGWPHASCDASDYRLTDPVMPVGRVVAPGRSVPFSGATIAFNNKIVNQDSCKLAIVSLRYTAS